MQQLSEAHDLIQTAVEKDQKRPKYNAIVTELELEVLNTKVVQDHLIKRTNIIQYGRELHRLIDAVIEKYEKEACLAEVEDLNFLGSEISKYINVRSDMLMSYERNQNTISSRNIARLLDYQSKNKDYIIVPDRYDIKVVPFDPLSLTPERFCQIIGDLSPSVKT